VNVAMNKGQVGQGFAEYAMGVSLLAVFALVALVLLGPAVGKLFDAVGNQLGTSGMITGVIAERTGHEQSNTVHVTVGVRRETILSVRDEASGEIMGPIRCRVSCLIILAGIGGDAGSVTIMTEQGHIVSAQYAARP
jgi:Flp pilus assembly pilin Flp